MKKIRTKILLAFAASGLLLLPSCGDWLGKLQPQY